jgi:hypothetical protein
VIRRCFVYFWSRSESGNQEPPRHRIGPFLRWSADLLAQRRLGLVSTSEGQLYYTNIN